MSGGFAFNLHHYSGIHSEETIAALYSCAISPKWLLLLDAVKDLRNRRVDTDALVDISLVVRQQRIPNSSGSEIGTILNLIAVSHFPQNREASSRPSGGRRLQHGEIVDYRDLASSRDRIGVNL